MKYFTLIIIAFLLSFVSCKNTPEQTPEDFAIQNTQSGDVLLRFKPKVGDKMDMMMNTTVESDGKENFDIDMGINFNLRTTDVVDSLYMYTLDIQKITLNSNMGGINVNYDSSKENEGFAAMINEQMKPILGNKFTFAMTNKAEIKSIEWQGQNIDMPVDKKSFNNMIIPLPEEPVTVGDTWTNNLALGDKGEMSTVFKIESITTDEVTISLNNDEANDDNTKVSGQYVLDRKTSFTKTGEINVETNIEEQPTTMKIIFKAL